MRVFAVQSRSFPQAFPQLILLQRLARTARDASSQESTFATVTVCSFSGAFTRIVTRVPGARGISARTPCRNAAIASTAASKRLSAGQCRDHVEGRSERPNRRTQNPGGDEYRPRSDTAGIIR